MSRDFTMQSTRTLRRIFLAAPSASSRTPACSRSIYTHISPSPGSHPTAGPRQLRMRSGGDIARRRGLQLGVSRPVCAATQHSRRLHTTPRCLAATGYTGPAAGISMEEYHQLADRTMNELFDRLEALVEEKDGFDVEFHADVLELETPNGTYVFNKQPPNKQIWLSSPVSGPKRYSWQDEQQEWVYTNTGSTLRELLREEVGVEIGEVRGG